MSTEDRGMLDSVADLAVGSMSLPEGLASRLRLVTPARVGLRSAGTSLATAELLDFQLAHARARDAVHATLQTGSMLAELRQLGVGEPVPLHSTAKNCQAYLQRPDLGRKLDSSSAERLDVLRGRGAFEIAFVVCDGLSALAVERHAVPLLRELIPLLQRTMRVAPVCLVEQGRVAIGDDIAQRLGARLAVVLIGERPGLSSPDSLGAYISWSPVPGKTTDAERNCISNIRAEGLGYKEAALRLRYYIGAAFTLGQTGTALKDPEVTALLEDGFSEETGEPE